MKHIAATLLVLLSPILCFAQLVKNERLLSFENPHVPAFITTESAQIQLSANHFKDGLQSLEYVVFPETNRQQMERFAKKPTYRVLQKDRNAHIVYDTEHNIYSYAVFEKWGKAVDPFILETDTACLLMLDTKKSM